MRNVDAETSQADSFNQPCHLLDSTWIAPLHSFFR